VIRARGQIRIERPPEAVFDFLADLTNEPLFNPDARDIVKVSEGDVRLGTVYTETVKPLGFFEVRVHQFERPRLLGYDAKNTHADIRVLFRFEHADGGTKLTAEMEMEPKGTFRLLTPLLGPMMRRTMQKQRAPRIKQAVEASPREAPAG
jgi:uncharacterized protein YndB with AHSA1/START domain